jgi:hypothetical protein
MRFVVCDYETNLKIIKLYTSINEWQAYIIYYISLKKEICDVVA